MVKKDKYTDELGQPFRYFYKNKSRAGTNQYDTDNLFISFWKFYALCTRKKLFIHGENAACDVQRRLSFLGAV